MPLHEFANTALKAACRRRSNLQAKATQDTTETHLNIVAFALHEFAGCQYCAEFLSWQ